MLGYVALIFLIILSVKVCVSFNRHIPVMTQNNVPMVKIRATQFSPLLYIPSLVAFVLPISWLVWLAPIPFGFLILIPGIVLGRKYSYMLDRAGTSDAANAGRAASNIMWLGIAVVIFMIGNIIFSLTLQSWSQFP